MHYFLTIDNGGTNTKVVLIDEHGAQVDVFSFPTKDIEPSPGFHEIQLDELFKNLMHAIKTLINRMKVPISEIVGITTVGHGKGLYVLNKDNRPFMNGILSADSRAESLAEKYESNVNQIFEISHQHVMPSQASVILKWLKDNRRADYDQIGAVLSNKDFIRYLLTGKVVQERGDASGNNLINLKTGEYDSRLTHFFGISEIYEALPSLVNATDCCGQISKDVARQSGLPEGLSVYAGMFDIDACAIATGVLDDSLFSIIAGTWNMNIFPSRTLAPESSGLMNSLLPTNQYLIEASSPTSAGNLNIIIKMLMTAEIRDAQASGKSIYDTLESFLESTDATFTKVLFYPFLYGSNLSPDAEGSFIGLRSGTTKSELIKSVYEGICFAHRQHFEQLLAVLGHRPKAIRMSGGAVNSPSWVQMFANVLNLPIELTDVSELGGLGGAMAIGVGANIFNDFGEAVNQMTHVIKRIEPDPRQVDLYATKYETYQTFGRAMDNQWEQLDLMQRKMNTIDD
ncbi:carbohydrate kinase FGGY family [Furfurilactobacillus rossiae]|uniref:FGGY-family carbohydrate kinase n=1 Tax=Furfurilactobacillus rossiae TaxID=231049 RepID=UPI0015BA90A2|nr:FGGY-family carbohydrate kinase [Furfurilactobacillus rossiae]QLE64334.1 carbohydrate kinase FGGY family [Furfurilactobacillus rossiae]